MGGSVQPVMPQGDKTPNPKRKAGQTGKSSQMKGASRKTAMAQAWAAANKRAGGGKRGGSPRVHDHHSSR